MDWIFDYVPWWVGVLAGFLGIGGGMVALMFFFPAAIPIVVGLWNRSPLWVRVALIGLTGGVIAWWIGRNQGRANAIARQQELDRRAQRNATEVQNEVNRLNPSEVDKLLEGRGDFHDDRPKGGTRRRF